jgi:hypothetical protein
MNEYTIEFLDGTQQKMRADYMDTEDGLLCFYSKLTSQSFLESGRILLAVNPSVIKVVTVVEFPELLKHMDEESRQREYENMINLLHNRWLDKNAYWNAREAASSHK